MKCPVCKNHEHQNVINLEADGFHESISTCSICGATWSLNHGQQEIVKDPQEKSFLEATTECVEGDDYSYAA